MRMMKTNKNETIMVIGIDHGYGNMKTATRCFPSCVARYEKEPIFQNNLLVYHGMFYQIGEEHKEFCAEKTHSWGKKGIFLNLLTAFLFFCPVLTSFIFAFFVPNAPNHLSYIQF